jgi:hypothetical protein
MNLLEVLMNANGGRSVEALSQQFGLSGDQTQSVLSQLLPALAAGVQNNVSQSGGLESLLGALTGGHHQQYIENPDMLADPNTVSDGNGILGHLLGSKDVSRALATQVAGNTGLSDSLIKQMLPIVASLAMGAMSSRANAAPTPQDGLAGMLDFDRDGSAVDDVIGLVGKLFGR